MAGARIPGPLGLHPHVATLEDGTLIRQLSPRRGPTCACLNPFVEDSMFSSPIPDLLQVNAASDQSQSGASAPVELPIQQHETSGVPGKAASQYRKTAESSQEAITRCIKNTSISVDGVSVSAWKIRTGENGKVAVIGRNMKGVEPYAAALAAQGIDVEIYGGPKISDAAINEFIRLARQFPGKIPGEVLMTTEIYLQNQAWINNIQSKGYSVVDVDNPFGADKSVFYEMEQVTVFGGEK